MATKTQKVKVGIFVLAGLALIVALFATVSIRRREPMDTYRIMFAESVSGLTRDCAVLYQGVPVGHVQDVRVTEDNLAVVDVGIAPRLVTLREGTTAMLAIGNLMGTMQIELSGGPTGSPPLPPGSVIPSKTSVLGNVAQQMPEILEKIALILAKIDTSIGEVQADRLGSLVRNADVTIQTANTTFTELTSFLQSSRGTMVNMEYEVIRTMRDLQDAIVKADRAIARLNENPSSLIWGRSAGQRPRVE